MCAEGSEQANHIHNGKVGPREEHYWSCRVVW